MTFNICSLPFGLDSLLRSSAHPAPASWPLQCCSNVPGMLSPAQMFPLPGMFFHLIFTWLTPHPLRFCSSAIFKKAPFDHCILNCVTASLSSPHPPLSFAFSLSPFNRPRNLIFVVFLAILHLPLTPSPPSFLLCFVSLFPQKRAGICVCFSQALREGGCRHSKDISWMTNWKVECDNLERK